MEQWHVFPAQVVEGSDAVALTQIASATGQTQVRLVAGTGAGGGEDVFHLEGKVEDGFGGMAILAAMTGAASHERIVRVHAGS
jgi:hypothetical protein